MSFIPKPHEIYKHFKGNLYQITALAEHTETGEQLVVYQALYGDFRTYARPLDMFVGRVDREKYPDAEQEFRFELQGPEAGRQREEAGLAEEGRTAEERLPGEEAKAESPRPEREALEKATPEKAALEREAPGKAASERGVLEKATLERETPEKAVSEREILEAEGPEAEEELNLDPLVLEFLDADEYGQRLNILAGLHHRITDEMITTMAIACDVEVGEGDVEERYEALKNCLMTLERYECNRIR